MVGGQDRKGLGAVLTYPLGQAAPDSLCLMRATPAAVALAEVRYLYLQTSSLSSFNSWPPLSLLMLVQVSALQRGFL